jgi:serine/threonine protein kinase
MNTPLKSVSFPAPVSVPGPGLGLGLRPHADVGAGGGLGVGTLSINHLGNYEVFEEVGHGGFGVVHKAKASAQAQVSSSSSKIGASSSSAVVSTVATDYAIKIIEKNGRLMQSPELLNRIQLELHIHAQCRNQYIVQFVESFETDAFICVVMELCMYGTLYGYLRRYGQQASPSRQAGLSELKTVSKLPESVCAHVLAQLLSAVDYLHTRLQVLHRYIKLSNILISNIETVEVHQDSAATTLQLLTVKLCDFGLSVQLSHPDDEHYTLCGTPNYLAPEIISNRQPSQSYSPTSPHSRVSPAASPMQAPLLTGHNNKIDIWACGCVLYYTLCGKAPFEECQPDGNKQLVNDAVGREKLCVQRTLERAMNEEFDRPSFLSAGSLSILELMLSKVSQSCDRHQKIKLLTVLICRHQTQGRQHTS